MLPGAEAFEKFSHRSRPPCVLPGTEAFEKFSHWCWPPCVLPGAEAFEKYNSLDTTDRQIPYTHVRTASNWVMQPVQQVRAGRSLESHSCLFSMKVEHRGISASFSLYLGGGFQTFSQLSTAVRAFGSCDTVLEEELE